MKLLRLSSLPLNRKRKMSVKKTSNAAALSKKLEEDNVSIESMQTAVTVSSTFSLPLHHNEDVVAPRPTRVSFNEQANAYYDNEQMTQDELDGLWLSIAEMKQIKSRAIYMAKEIYQQDTQQAVNAIFTYTNTILHSFHACADGSVLGRTERHHLAAYVQGHITRLGLERMCIKALATDKRSRRKLLLNAVLKVQSQTALKGQSCDEQLRAACEPLSQPSRLFARELGLALALPTEAC